MLVYIKFFVIDKVIIKNLKVIFKNNNYCYIKKYRVKKLIFKIFL